MTNDGRKVLKTQDAPVRWDEAYGNPQSDFQTWVDKMKQPQPFRKPQCSGCYRIIRLDEFQKNGYLCDSCMGRLSTHG